MTKNTKIIIGVLVVILIAGAGYMAMNKADESSFGETLEDAAGEISDGIDDAVSELEGSAPAEEVQDKIEDAAETIAQ